MSLSVDVRSKILKKVLALVSFTEGKESMLEHKWLCDAPAGAQMAV